MNRGEHSLSLGGLYGAALAAGVSKMLPALSSTNISWGCMRSFGTPVCDVIKNVCMGMDRGGGVDPQPPQPSVEIISIRPEAHLMVP